MPLIDLNESSFSSFKNQYDIIIIGAGAAGILLSLKLTEKGKKVLLIESGHFFEDEKRQILNTVEQSGKLLANAVWGRKRAIGGTTIAWGGQSLPFSALDFEKRNWVDNSGWPIKYSDLESFYLEANQFMNIDGLDYKEDIFRLLKMERLTFQEDIVEHHFSKWAPEPNFRKMYEGQLKNSTTVLYNAVVTNLRINDKGEIDLISIKNYNNREFQIPVNLLIIAAGAIETNRLLLSSNNQLQNGLSNSSQLVGKYFMDHPCIVVGEIKAEKQFNLQKHFNTHIKKARKYSVRLSLSSEAQRKLQLLNASAGIMFYYKDESLDPYREVKEYFQSRKVPSVFTIAKNLKGFALSSYAYAQKKFLYKHKASAKLVLMLEQEPIKESTITLSDDTDILGCKKVNINWKISEKTWQTTLFLSNYLMQQLKQLDLGELRIRSCVSGNNTLWANELSDVCHHMGGTRLSETKSDGVVNKDLQSWDHKNLFICSTSVFPTGSHSNPTLTLLALGCRLADFLTKTTANEKDN